MHFFRDYLRSLQSADGCTRPASRVRKRALDKMPRVDDRLGPQALVGVTGQLHPDLRPRQVHNQYLQTFAIGESLERAGVRAVRLIRKERRPGHGDDTVRSGAGTTRRVLVNGESGLAPQSLDDAGQKLPVARNRRPGDGKVNGST